MAALRFCDIIAPCRAMSRAFRFGHFPPDLHRRRNVDVWQRFHNCVRLLWYSKLIQIHTSIGIGLVLSSSIEVDFQKYLWIQQNPAFSAVSGIATKTRWHRHLKPVERGGVRWRCTQSRNGSTGLTGSPPGDFDGPRRPLTGLDELLRQ